MNKDKECNRHRNKVMLRGEFSPDDRNCGVYRGQAERSYLDPQTGEFLGTMVHSIGSVQGQEQAGDIATMHVSVASEELLAGDRLLASEERRHLSRCCLNPADSLIATRAAGTE